MRKIIRLVMLILVMIMSIEVVSADRIDEVPISIKVFFKSDDLNKANYVTISSPDYSRDLYFSTYNNNDEINHKLRYLPNNMNNIIDIPIKVRATYSGNIFNGMYVQVEDSSWNKVGMGINNSYMNFTYSLLISSSSDYYGYQNNDMKSMFNETLSRMDKNFKTSNEDFSSTFIQYFSNQYEPKMEQIREKDEQIESLRSEIKSRDDKLNMMSLNYTIAKSGLDDAKTENMFLAFFSVVLLIMMVSFLAVKKGFIKTMRGVN